MHIKKKLGEKLVSLEVLHLISMFKEDRFMNKQVFLQPSRSSNQLPTLEAEVFFNVQDVPLC